MSFITRLFHKPKKNPAPPLVDRKPAPPRPEPQVSRSSPAAPAGDPLSEMRFRARTGDPKLTARHHSGSFSEKK